MSTNGESSYAKDIIETRQKSNIDDDSSFSDEYSMYLIGTKTGTTSHFESTDYPDVDEENETAFEFIDFTYSCVADYLQDRRRRWQDLQTWYKMNDFLNERDFYGDHMCKFEDFADSDENDESSCDDELQDSIRLTRSRFLKEGASVGSQNCQARKDCSVE
jgi:hypothetical protein